MHAMLATAKAFLFQSRDFPQHARSEQLELIANLIVDGQLGCLHSPLGNHFSAVVEVEHFSYLNDNNTIIIVENPNSNQ